MKGEVFRIFLVISLIIGTIAVVGWSAASSEPVFSVDPERVEDKWPGATFTVNITIANVTQPESLQAWEFAFNFSSSILNVTNFQEGPFLQAAGPTWWTQYIDNEAGKVGGGCLLLAYPQPGAYGSGVLASITFQVKAEGYTFLQFYLTELRHWNGTDLLEIDHSSVDGFFTNLHDIAVTDVVPSPDAVLIGESVSIDVTVANRGNFTETFDVTTYYDDNPIETQTDIVLESGASTTRTFTWYTTGVSIGTYNISASATEIPHEINTANNNFTKIDAVKVKQADAPVARFTYYPEFPVVNQLVTFNASTSTPDGGELVDPDSYFWDFDDGANDTGMVVTHLYSQIGTYIVNLTVTDSHDQTDSTTESITVKKQSSTISISASQTIVAVGGSTNISGSIDPKREGVNVIIQSNKTGDVTFRDLDEDMHVTTDKNGHYSYLWEPPEEEKKYWVNASWAGDENTFPASDLLTIEVLKPPTALFLTRPSIVIAYESVTFDADSSKAEENRTIVTYEWDFGDNTPSVSENDPTTPHTFTTVGTYNVTLTVTDSEGLKDTWTEQITVLQRPTAAFTYSPQPPPVGETITFDASESYDDGEIVSYKWDFGDNTTETYKNENLTAIATHVYAETGNYTVRLTVTDNDGLAHTVEESILIVAPQSNVVLYAVAVVAAAITVATLAIYFLKIKKTKPK